jgi:transposase
VVDTIGLLVSAVIHPANVQGRDGGLLALEALFDRYPLLLKLFADAAYQEPKFRDGAKQIRRGLDVEIVKRSDPRFKVLPKRWVLERTFAWLG